MRTRSVACSLVVALLAQPSVTGCGGSSLRHLDDEGDGDIATGGVAGTVAGGTSGEELGGSVGVGPGGNAGLGGNAGFGGSAGVPLCTDPDYATANLSIAVQSRGTATGISGAFTDFCDDAGNLVEYFCESICTPASVDAESPGARLYKACAGFQTGQVIRVPLNCGGRCTDGTCFQWCPIGGESFTVVEVTEGSVRMSGTNGFEYECRSIGTEFDIDCDGEALTGRTLDIFVTPGCAAHQVVFDASDPSNGPDRDCQYRCTFR